MRRAKVVIMLAVALLHLDAWAQETMPGFVLIPAGQFEMGDHHNYADPQHPCLPEKPYPGRGVRPRATKPAEGCPIPVVPDNSIARLFTRSQGISGRR